MAITFMNPQFKRLTETPQRKTYVVALITIIIVVCLIFFANRPAIVSIFDRVNENETKNELLAQMDDKYNTLINLNEQESNNQKSVQILNAALPQEKNEASLVKDISSMVTTTKLSLESMSIQDNLVKDSNTIKRVETLSTKYDVLILNIVVQGKRSDLVSLVSKIENYPRPLNITKISYQSGLETEIIRATLEIETYYMLKT